jgi:hypothetical protein
VTRYKLIKFSDEELSQFSCTASQGTCKKEEMGSPETSVNLYQITHRHVTELETQQHASAATVCYFVDLFT